MRAAIIKQAGPLSIETLSGPALARGDVVVKVARCGVCGSGLQSPLAAGLHGVSLVKLMLDPWK